MEKQLHIKKGSMENLSAKNYRVGNIVKQPGRIGKISEVWQDAVRLEGYSNGYDYNHTKPIHLTEKWLIEFGFSGQPYDYTKDKLSVCLKDSDSFHKAGRTYYNSWAILEKQPTYVHELQNLFFALTGLELEIKELA